MLENQGRGLGFVESNTGMHLQDIVISVTVFCDKVAVFCESYDFSHDR